MTRVNKSKDNRIGPEPVIAVPKPVEPKPEPVKVKTKLFMNRNRATLKAKKTKK